MSTTPFVWYDLHRRDAPQFLGYWCRLSLVNGVYDGVPLITSFPAVVDAPNPPKCSSRIVTAISGWLFPLWRPSQYVVTYPSSFTKTAYTLQQFLRHEKATITRFSAYRLRLFGIRTYKSNRWSNPHTGGHRMWNLVFSVVEAAQKSEVFTAVAGEW